MSSGLLNMILIIQKNFQYIFIYLHSVPGFLR